MYLESEAYIKKIFHFGLYKTLCDKKYTHSVEAKHERSLNLYYYSLQQKSFSLKIQKAA